jgi:hypothetical protein
VNPGIHIGLHWWRGIGTSNEPNLFWFEYRLGFATLSIERTWPLFQYRKLRTTMEQAVERAEAAERERGYPWKTDTSPNGDR